MTGPARIPKLVADYFGRYVPGWSEADVRKAHPVIIQTFVPGRGWRNTGYNKRVSVSWLRKLRAEGVTIVALEAPSNPGRRIDFGIKEICRAESGSWPCGICA